MIVQILISGELSGEEIKIDKRFEGSNEEILRVQQLVGKAIKLIKEEEQDV